MRGAEATIGTTVRALATAFRHAGIDTADLDARRLVASALTLTPERLITDAGRPVDPAAGMLVEQYRARRLCHEPVSRILGIREFYGRDFKVTPAVLDPRADTETLVELAVMAIDRSVRRADAQPPFHVLDIGVGSGAILATLLAERPHIRGTGIDISAAALAVARSNTQALGVTPRATLASMSIADALRTPFDLVVSNPPYIPSADIGTLDPEVAEFDPPLALDGGADGLDIYREMFHALAAAPMRPTVILEFGVGQADTVVQLAHDLWLSRAKCRATIRHDLADRPRCVILEPHI